MSGAASTEHATSDLTHRASTSERPPGVGARILLAVIAVYRATASVRQPRCRFSPTCSQYAADSIRTHGAVRGGWDALRRIGRCHPWNPGGYDPVRPRK